MSHGKSAPVSLPRGPVKFNGWRFMFCLYMFIYIYMFSLYGGEWICDDINESFHQTIHGATPISSISIGFSIINHPFWGIPIWGNPPIRLNTPFCTAWFNQFISYLLFWREAPQQPNNINTGQPPTMSSRLFLRLGRTGCAGTLTQAYDGYLMVQWTENPL